jgi:hypothetical protein
MAAAPARFTIRTPTGEVEEVKDDRYNEKTTLSKAITYALRADRPGTWEVVEWEDVLYRVHRSPAQGLDVRIEVA